MLNAIIESSLNNRFFVLMATLLVGGLGCIRRFTCRSTRCPT